MYIIPLPIFPPNEEVIKVMKIVTIALSLMFLFLSIFGLVDNFKKMRPNTSITYISIFVIIISLSALILSFISLTKKFNKPSQKSKNRGQ